MRRATSSTSHRDPAGDTDLCSAPAAGGPTTSVGGVEVHRYSVGVPDLCVALSPNASQGSFSPSKPALVKVASGRGRHAGRPEP